MSLRKSLLLFVTLLLENKKLPPGTFPFVPQQLQSWTFAPSSVLWGSEHCFRLSWHLDSLVTETELVFLYFYFTCKDVFFSLYSEFSILISDENSQSGTFSIYSFKEISLIQKCADVCRAGVLTQVCPDSSRTRCIMWDPGRLYVRGTVWASLELYSGRPLSKLWTLTCRSLNVQGLGLFAIISPPKGKSELTGNFGI